MLIETPAQFVELQKRCIEETLQVIEDAKSKTGIVLPYRPQIRFGLRGMTAGTANGEDKIIQFNPTLLRENPEHFVRFTTRHEVAHLLARHVYSDSIDAHGQEWRKIVLAIGGRNERCHSYSVRNVPTMFGKTRNPHAVRQDGRVKQTEFGRVIQLD